MRDRNLRDCGEHTHDGFPGSNPNGFLIVARVHKSFVARFKTITLHKGLRPGARMF